MVVWKYSSRQCHITVFLVLIYKDTVDEYLRRVIVYPQGNLHNHYESAHHILPQMSSLFKKLSLPSETNDTRLRNRFMTELARHPRIIPLNNSVFNFRTDIFEAI